VNPVERYVVTELRRVIGELMILAFVAGAATSAVTLWILKWLGL
jgi:hypothetical protein